MVRNQGDLPVKSQRVKTLRTTLGLTQADFAARIGSGQGPITHIENGRRNVGPNVEYKILHEFGVNPEWWEKGEGPIFLKDVSASMNRVSSVHIETNTEPINGTDDLEYAPVIDGAEGVTFQQLPDGTYLMSMPLVDQYAIAGYLSGYADTEFLEELPRHTINVEKRYTGIYRSFRVRGDSMDNDSNQSIPSGSIVAGRKVEREYYTHNRLHLRKWQYFVIVHNEGIVTKEIVDHDVDFGKLYVRSLNPDKEMYPDYVIRMDSVLEIYNIVSKTFPMSRRV